MNSTPKPGAVLRGDGSVALVVAPGTSAPEALHELVDLEYGWGSTPPPMDHPQLVSAIERHGLRVERWRSFTKLLRELECVDDIPGGDWWGPHGDGRRVILVLNFEGDLFGLGDAVMDEPAVAHG